MSITGASLARLCCERLDAVEGSLSVVTGGSFEDSVVVSVGLEALFDGVVLTCEVELSERGDDVTVVGLEG